MAEYIRIYQKNIYNMYKMLINTHINDNYFEECIRENEKYL